MKYGVDVSKWQGDVNFEKVKNSNIDFVIIRAGWSRTIDEKANRNYNEAKKQGLKIGFYWYSYARNGNEALEEAKACSSFLKDKVFDLPVFYDVEDNSQTNLSQETMNNIVNNFCIYLENEGYFVGIYSMKSWLDTKFKNFKQRFDFWTAHWTEKPNFTYSIHQYSNKGEIQGIQGRVDLDVLNRDYSIIKELGLNNNSKLKSISIENLDFEDFQKVSNFLKNEKISFKEI